MTTTALTDYTGFQRQLDTIESNSKSLSTQNDRLNGEINDAEAGIREKRKAMHENNVMLATNAHKARAIGDLVRSFEDADTMRQRALADYEA